MQNDRTGADTHDSGFGDVQGYLLWAPWETSADHKEEFLSRHNLSFLFGLSLPTGDERNGDAPALHFNQTGSGSIDTRIGALYNAPISGPMRVYSGLSFLIDGGSDTSRFRNGTLTDFRIGGSYAPSEIGSVFLSIDWINRRRNLSAGNELGDSGGTWTFLEVGGTLTPWRRSFIDAAVAIPIYRNVHHTQPVSDEVFSLGFGWKW